MSEFLNKMLGDEPAKKRYARSHVLAAEEVPDLAGALSVLMHYAMNRPDGSGGIRTVGDTCKVYVGDIEISKVGPDGEHLDAGMGDFQITIERLK